MPTHTTYTRARAELASLLDKAIRERDVIVIQRRGSEDVALLPAAELASLTETAYLLRSPANAKRLLAALERALKSGGSPMTREQLEQEVGLGSQKP